MFLLQEAQRQDRAAEMVQPSAAKNDGSNKAINNIWDSAADISLGAPRDQNGHAQNGAACKPTSTPPPFLFTNLATQKSCELPQQCFL